MAMVIDPRATLPAGTHRPGSAAPQLQHQPLCAERHHGHRGPRKVQHLVECSCDAHVPGPFARQPSTAPNVGPPARARHPATRLGADHGGTHAQAQRRPVLARQRPPGQASASPCCPLTPEPAGSRSRVDPDDALREAVAKDHRVPLTGRGPGACSGAGAHLGMSAPKAHHPARLAGTLLSCRSSSSTSQSVPTGAAAQPTESRVEPFFFWRARRTPGR